MTPAIGPVLDANSDNPFVQYDLGKMLLSRGKYPKAYACFKVCNKLPEDHIALKAAAIQYQIQALRLAGQMPEALCCAMEGCRSYPQYTDLYFEGGVVLEHMGEYEVAIRWFRSAIDSGTPPILFNHVGGTENYRSFFHLGCCYRQLGLSLEAAACFEQAIAIQPDYFDAIHGLFQMLADQPAIRIKEILEEKGLLNRDPVAETVAELFFVTGKAELARKITDGRKLADSSKFVLYQIYGDAVEAAVEFLREAPATLAPVERIMACLLNGDSDEARKAAVLLWQKPTGRDGAWAMLSLVAQVRGEGGFTLPEPAREAGMVNLLLGLLERCLNSAAECRGHGKYDRIAEAIMDCLVQRTRQGREALSDYLGKKSRDVLEIMVCSHSGGRSLFL